MHRVNLFQKAITLLWGITLSRALQVNIEAIIINITIDYLYLKKSLRQHFVLAGHLLFLQAKNYIEIMCNKNRALLFCASLCSQFLARPRGYLHLISSLCPIKYTKGILNSALFTLGHFSVSRLWDPSSGSPLSCRQL